MSHYPTLPDSNDWNNQQQQQPQQQRLPPPPPSQLAQQQQQQQQDDTPSAPPSLIAPPPPQQDDSHSSAPYAQQPDNTGQANQQPEYAPPLHTLPQHQSANSGPPQWVPACIPNPHRVNYSKPCYIICGKNNLYLNVNQVIPNCPINAWTKTHSSQQKWYFTEDGYVELAADRTFVLDCVNVQVGAQLVLGKKKIPQNGNAVDPSVVSQKWNVVEADGLNYLCNVQKPTLIIELAGSTRDYDKGDLVRINSNLSLNNDHQRWTIKTTYTGLTKEENLYPIGTKCYIYNALSGLYLTVKGSGLLSKGKAGSQVIAAKGKVLGGAKAQTWVFDKEGFIHSILDKTGNLVLDAKSGQCGEELCINTKQYTNNLSQKWIVKQPASNSTNKHVNLKACRYIYSQLNTNVIVDEKGENEGVYLNFDKHNTNGQQVWKIRTAGGKAAWL